MRRAHQFGLVVLLLLASVMTTSAEIVEVAPQNLDSFLAASTGQKNCVVEFFDPNCPDCQRFASTYDSLERDFSSALLPTGVTFVKVNVGRYLGSPAYAVRNQYGIREIPSLMLFSPQGKATSRFIGHPFQMSFQAVGEWIKSQLVTPLQSSSLLQLQQLPPAKSVVVVKTTTTTTTAGGVTPTQQLQQQQQQQQQQLQLMRKKRNSKFQSAAIMKKDRRIAKQMFRRLANLTSMVQEASTLIASEARLTHPDDHSGSCLRCHTALSWMKTNVKQMWKILIKNSRNLRNSTSRRIADELSALDAQIEQEERTVKSMFAH